MPQVSNADLNTLRSNPHFSRLGLLIFRAPVIYSGQISGSPAQGATTITLSGVSQTETPVLHYTLVAGSSAGNDDGGKTRFKSLAGSTLTVAANSIEWQTYPFISILREILPWSIIPDLANDKMDGTKTYSDENTNFHPLGRIGPPAWGFKNETIKFYSNSQSVAAGASISSHSWSFPDGSPSTSSSAGSAGTPVEVTWAATTGHIPHYFTYTATDSNGKTHTRYNPVWILDNFEECYCNFELESLSGDYGSGGWQARIRVFGDATTSEFPQDAMIMLVAEDYYAGFQTSVGGNWDHRENVVFVGWIVRDTVFKDDEDGAVSFEVFGPVPRMNQLTSWPANLEDRASPAAWNQLKSMTCDLAAFHVFTERSTLDHICDINLSGNTRRLRYVDIPESKLNTQVDDYCLSPIGAKGLSDRQGQIYLSRNPNLRPTAERTALNTVMAVELGDVRADPGLELGVEEQEFQVAQVDFIAFKYSGEDVEPLYSLVPENQYASGNIEKVDGVRADDQDEANVLSGMYLANFNNIFREVKFPTWNYRVFDIVPEEYTTLTLVASDTQRGIVWTNQKLICRNISISYDRDREAILVDPTFEKNSFGPPGVGGGYPKSVPDSESYPIARDSVGDALVAWNSFFIRKAGADWIERGGQASFNHGTLDPWWFSREKSSSLDPDQSILFGCADEAVIKRTEDGGVTWVARAPSAAPPNTWGDVTAPVLANVDFIWLSGDIFRNGRFYAMGQWQETDSGNSHWRSWLVYSDDNGLTWAWSVLYDGATLPTQLKSIALASNKDYVLVTVFVDEASDVLRLLLLDATDLSFVRQYDLGASTLTQMDEKTYWAFPVTVTDVPDIWFVAGRLNAPQGLSDIQHIVKVDDAGGAWSSFENTWSTDICGALFVKEEDDNGDRKYFAARQPA